MKKTHKVFLQILLCILSLQASIIRTGNVLNIKVMSYPEFSGTYIVNQNGTIDYPLFAEEQVVNISTTELMNDLTFRLARHIDNPLVLVSIVEKPEITITVLGHVVNPGPVTVYQGASLQEAIQRAGGVAPSANVYNIKVIHRERPHVPEYFDMNQFLRDGDISKMPKLDNEDVIVLLAQEQTRKVKVIGSVQKPGLFSIDDPITVFEIIYMAGGPAEKADLSKVRRLWKQDDKSGEEIIDIQNYIDKGKMDEIPLVNQGDVIIIYSRWFDWKTVLTVLNNTLLFIVTIQALAGIFK